MTEDLGGLEAGCEVFVGCRALSLGVGEAEDEIVVDEETGCKVVVDLTDLLSFGLELSE